MAEEGTIAERKIKLEEEKFKFKKRIFNEIKNGKIKAEQLPEGMLTEKEIIEKPVKEEE